MKTARTKPKEINFSFLGPLAENVLIAGDFNDWNTISHPMKKDKKGVWKISLNLRPGTYQYNFYVDGEWQNDPNCTEYVENPFGTLNCVKTIE